MNSAARVIEASATGTLQALEEASAAATLTVCVAVGVLSCLGTVAAIEGAHLSHQFALLWPVTGLVAGLLLAFPAAFEERPLSVGAAIAVGAAVGSFAGAHSVFLSAGLAGCTVLDSVLTLVLLRDVLKTRRDLRTPATLFRMAMVGGLVSTLSPALRCWPLSIYLHRDVELTFLYLALSHALGFALLLPLTFDVLSSLKGDQTSFQPRPTVFVPSLALFFVCAYWLVLFADPRLLFLLFPLMLLVVRAAGFMGATFCSLLLSPIAWLDVMHGGHLLSASSGSNRLLLMQAFVVAFYVTALWSGLSQEGHTQSQSLLSEARDSLACKVRQLEESMQLASSLVDQLENSESRFRALMHNGPLLAYIKDADGRLCFYNRRLAEQFGVDLQTWLGKTDHDVWPDKVAAKLREADLRVLAQERIIEFDEETVDAHGDRREWKSYKFPFVDLTGKRFLAGMSMDVTEEKRLAKELEASAEKLREANDALNELTLTDPLTQLHNRRYLDKAMERECAHVRLRAQPLSVLLIDIDHFKSVNDTFGHAFGDEILCEVSQILSRTVRAGDHVCRAGGEEFAVLLPGTPLEQARHLASRIREAVAQGPWTERCITVSVGVGSSELLQICEGRHLSALADAALYAAKAGGRNRVHVASEGEWA